MENTTMPAAQMSQPLAVPGSKTTFSQVWQETWKIFQKKFLMLGLVYLPVIVINLLMQYFIFSAISRFIQEYLNENPGLFKNIPPGLPSTMMIKEIIFVILIILLGIVFTLFFHYIATACAYQLVHRRDDQNFTVTEGIKIAFHRVWEAFVLALRNLIYILAWQIIPLGLMAGSFYGMSVGKNQAGGWQEVSGILFFLSTVALVIVTIRASVSVFFTTPFLFIMENPKSKAVFEKSKAATKHYIWRIFANTFFLGLIVGIISGVYSGSINMVNYSTPGMTEITEEFQSIVPTQSEDGSLNEEESQARMEKIGKFAEGIIKTPEKRQEIIDSVVISLFLKSALSIPLMVFVFGFNITFIYTLAMKVLEEKNMALE